jgi:hypothetical protein
MATTSAFVSVGEFAFCEHSVAGRRICLLATPGMAREYLSELENGHKEIGVKTFERISAALNTKLSQFFEGLD